MLLTEPTEPLLPMAPRDRTLPRMLQRQAALRPGKRLLTIGQVRWTHADAVVMAAGRAGALRAAGVKRGDRVAFMCGNRVEALELFLACAWLGAAAVPINTGSMGPQIRYLLENSGATLFAIEQQYLERLASVVLRDGFAPRVWVIAGSEHGEASGSAGGLATAPYPEAADPVLPEDVLPSDPIAILYTSGTTGPAKGVICPHGQYYWFGMNSALMLGVQEHDVLSTTLPLFHINALNTFAQASIVGCEAVFHRRFSASRFWESSQACGATVIYLLGAMVPMLLAQPASLAEKQHAVRIGLGGGAPAAAIDQFLARTGIPLVEGYASTETSVVITSPPQNTRRGVMGWLRPGFHARVVDEQDAEVPRGEAGELVLRADEPFAFSNGYFGMPEKTVEAWRNLWFHTGDRVVQEQDGAFRFLDRMKDAIRRRGENVSAYEVEQVLLSHAQVAIAAVFPVRSDLAEDEVMAAIVPKEGELLDLQELADFCERRLPYFAVPRYFDVVRGMPRTENGKVQKFKLREQGRTETSWERPSATARRGRGGTDAS
jgi:crotonobetaine/carnitine-CoA ligase